MGIEYDDFEDEVKNQIVIYYDDAAEDVVIKYCHKDIDIFIKMLSMVTSGNLNHAFNSLLDRYLREFCDDEEREAVVNALIQLLNEDSVGKPLVDPYSYGNMG